MSFESESYGRFEIKSGPLGGKWAANAFRRKQLVAKAAGATREEAVTAIKKLLDDANAKKLDEADAEGAPSAAVYEAAFSYLLPNFADSYVAMLRAHLSAPDYLISATKLAQAAGYSGYEGANLHYGKLGALVAEEIGFDPPRREDGTAIWTCAIARDPSVDLDFPHTSLSEALMRNIDTAHFEWQLRPQVVDALRSLRF